MIFSLRASQSISLKVVLLVVVLLVVVVVSVVILCKNVIIHLNKHLYGVDGALKLYETHYTVQESTYTH